MLAFLFFSLFAAAQGTWLQKLTEAGLPAPAADNLVALGFSSADLFLHGCRKEDALEEFLKFLLVDSSIADGVTDANWRFHPVTAALSGVWHALRGSSASIAGSKAVEAASSVGLQLAERVAGKKLDATLRDDLRSAFLKAYPGELFTPMWDPCDSYLQLTWAMFEERDLRWHPWRQIVSKAAWLTLEAAKSSKAAELDGPSALVRMLAKSQGLQEPDEMDVSANFFRVLCILMTRMVAFAVCKAAHLSGLRSYVNRFMELYSAKPLQPGRRGPTLAEAESADQVVWMEVFRLMQGGACMDDAIHEAVVQRDMLHSLLNSQTKEVPAGQVPGKGGKGAAGKAGAKGFGKAPGAAVKRPDPYSKLEACRNFAAGRCNKGDACKFSHGPPGSF